MYDLKALSKDAVPSALQKARDYRLMKEPYEAESICLDVLRVDPENQDALITLLLSLTDKFPHELNHAFKKALDVLERLTVSYCKQYYSGIIYERRARVHLERTEPGSGQVAFEWFTKAMTAYDNAMTTCDPGNQDAVLRWNTCARILNENETLQPDANDNRLNMLDSWD